MKRILIFAHAMELGGAESALLGLLENIDKKKDFTVDLFLMRHSGALLKYVPSSINILPELKSYSSIEIPIAEAIKRKEFLIAAGRIVGKIMSKIQEHYFGFQNSIIPIENSHKYVRFAMPLISNIEYDVAISFQSPHYFVSEKVKAKKKIAWIHTDYSAVNLDVTSELKMWNRYDHIISISDCVTDSFNKVFPELKHKIVQIENPMPTDYIDSQSIKFSAHEEMPLDDSIRLLSIGRFSAAKNFDSVPEICKHLLDMGISVTWYIIGYGSDEGLIRSRISEAHMERNVIILGKKDNPYPYIKNCNIYVQPSRYEGKSIAVREAQYLGKPVIITAFPSSKSQVQDGIDGIIVPMDSKKCAEAIASVISNNKLQERLIANCEGKTTNIAEMEKLYNIL